MANEDITRKAVDLLWQVMVDAELKTGRQLLQEVAKELGVTELQGRTVTDYYETLRKQIVERRLSTHADHDPNVVSEMKLLWDALQKKTQTPSEE